MKKTITSAAFLFFLATGAFAQYPRENQYPGNGRYDTRMPMNDRQEALMIDDLQREARLRIADGIANGTLTPRESIRLLSEFDRIQQKERHYLSNRSLNRRETRELTSDLQNLIRGIHYEKQDSQRERDRMAQRRY
jgi:hypothetical protein